LRGERLTGHEVFCDDRLRTNEVVELILSHFLIADVDDTARVAPRWIE
jgi:hypothetical protein